jgi:ferritin-like metal-binding protein YciE
VKLVSLHDLFVDQLRDLYSAENQIIKALPKMARAASNPELRSGFEEHLEQTREHAKRLEQIFEQLDTSAGGKKCKAVEGLIDEGKELMAEDAEPAVLDAGLIAGAQRVEHYEMAGYACVRTWVQQLGYTKAARLLEEALSEEKATDAKLSELAEQMINEPAAATA